MNDLVFGRFGKPGATIIFGTLYLIGLIYLTNFRFGEWIRTLLRHEPKMPGEEHWTPEERGLARQARELQHKAQRLQEEVERSGLGADLQPRARADRARPQPCPSPDRTRNPKPEPPSPRRSRKRPAWTRDHPGRGSARGVHAGHSGGGRIAPAAPPGPDGEPAAGDSGAGDDASGKAQVPRPVRINDQSGSRRPPRKPKRSRSPARRSSATTSCR